MSSHVKVYIVSNKGIEHMKICLKKNLDASKPSEHPPSEGKLVIMLSIGHVGYDT